ncbi:MAG: hypothetical protein OSJ62_16605 [Lachnospiraceae bacterium]|nr:hypothetical protein [Lachnospiraceae bacterium]
MQQAKRPPFFAIREWQKILGIDRGIRLSNFPPKSQQQEMVSPLWLFLFWRWVWLSWLKNSLFLCLWICDIMGESGEKAVCFL